MTDDITANNHGGDEFSNAAYESLSSERKHRDKMRILSAVRQSGGSTCDEVEIALGLSHQTCSARFSEMRRDGWIVDTGEKRKTRTGRWARVHCAVEETS